MRVEKKDQPAPCWHLEQLLEVSRRHRWDRSSASSPWRWPCCACASWWWGWAGAGSSSDLPSPSSLSPLRSCMPLPETPEKRTFFLKTSNNNNYRKLKYQHYTTSTLYMIISWFFLLPSFTCFSLSKKMVFVFVSMLQMSNVFPIAMWLFNQDSREWDVWGMMGI